MRIRLSNFLSLQKRSWRVLFFGKELSSKEENKKWGNVADIIRRNWQPMSDVVNVK